MCRLVVLLVFASKCYSSPFYSNSTHDVAIYSSDAAIVYSAGSSGDVYAWCAECGKLLSSKNAHSARISKMIAMPNSDYDFATSDKNGVTVLWKNMEPKKHNKNTGETKILLWHKKLRNVILSDRRKIIQIWNENISSISKQISCDDDIQCGCLSANGQFLAVATSEKICIYSIADNYSLKTTVDFKDALCMTFGTSEDIYAGVYSTTDKTVAKIDLKNKSVTDLSGPYYLCCSLAHHQQKNILYCAGSKKRNANIGAYIDDQIVIINCKTLAISEFIESTNFKHISTLCISESADRIIVGMIDKRLNQYSILSKKSIPEQKTE
jgi:WD40 repeat protein